VPTAHTCLQANTRAWYCCSIIMKTNICLLVCLCCLLFSLVKAHSWVQCTDYTEENGRAWSASNCRGWPRGYPSAFQYTSPPYLFGGDSGYNYQPTDAKACRSPPTTGDYSSTYPKATYSPGQRVCLAWPPKNHVAAKCNNPNIPDHGTRLYRSDVNPKADPTLTQFRTKLVKDFGSNVGVQGLGFQNCPDFCHNADKCLCTGCFDVPSDLSLGTYTFLWEWDFNSDKLSDAYTTCWEADIVTKSNGTITKTYPHVAPDDFKGF